MFDQHSATHVQDYFLSDNNATTGKNDATGIENDATKNIAGLSIRFRA
jgi:hypothetical protein